MNKFNKKGFTLIEMLVVIAIIAVLVSIVIPTVSSSTAKAKAATDAANLRSAKAAITIGVLDGSVTTKAQAMAVANANGVPTNSKYDGGSFDVELGTAAANTSGITVKVMYGTNTISYYAEQAGGNASDPTQPTT